MNFVAAVDSTDNDENKENLGETIMRKKANLLRDSLDSGNPTPAKATVENDDGDVLEVIYDPVHQCYYDPKSNCYYELE